MCPYSRAVHVVVLTEVSLCSVSLLMCCMSVAVKAFGDDVKAVLDKNGVIFKDLSNFKDVFPEVVNDDSEVSSFILTVHCTR